jgi:hypothetical protein
VLSMSFGILVCRRVGLYSATSFLSWLCVFSVDFHIYVQMPGREVYQSFDKIEARCRESGGVAFVCVL